MAANASQEIALAKVPFWTGIRRLFYLVSPSESSFETIEEVPKYVDQSAPFFFVLVAIEAAMLWMQKRPQLRWADAFSSVCAGTLSRLPLLLFKNIELSAFVYVYEDYRVTELPWDSPLTWWIAMLGVDLGYYWVHRMAHEVNFMWAAHQVHHSSEDYNLTTALRQSALQRYNSWIFYLPLAFFVPPSVFLVHIQFNLLYQFWIHTEVVRTMGPLEYILNTPSHHRVHHGRNRYCIDKNYAGVLIIWDRMFGTFVKEEEEVVYGLVHPISSWEPIYIQMAHWKYILETAWQTEGLKNKIGVFLNGPGWSPGKPRMGCIEDIPDIHAPQGKYDKALPSAWLHVYCWLHFALAILGQQVLSANKEKFSQWMVLIVVLYLVWTLTNIGLIYEHRWQAAFLEVMRCSVYLLADSYLCSGGVCSPSLYIVRTLFAVSLCIWAMQCARMFKVKGKVE